MKYIILALTLVSLASCTKRTPDDTVSSADSSPSSPAQTVEGDVAGDKQVYAYDRELALHWPSPLKKDEVESVEKELTKKNYYVVFDGSGSMDSSGCSDGKTKESVAKQALNVFANQIPNTVNLGLLTFDNSDIREVVTLASDNKAAFLSAVAASRTGGGTPLKSAIAEGVRRLGTQARKQLGYGEYHLVVVTDGEADYGEDPKAVVNFVVANTPVVIHTIGFCLDDRHSLNQVGKTDYKAATSPEDLVKGLSDVLAESESFSVDNFKQ